MRHKVYMVQVTNNKWKIVNENNQPIREDILLGHVSEAIDFVRRYVSSFSSWDFEIISLRDKDERSKK